MIWTDLLFVAAIAAGTAGIGLLAVYHGSRSPASAPPPHPSEDPDDAAILLFDGEDVRDMADEAMDVIGIAPEQADWDSIRACLDDRFADLPTTLDTLPHEPLTAPARDPGDPASLVFTRYGTATRVQLAVAGQADAPPDPPTAENLTLRRALDTSPFPCWQTEASGRVIYANPAYDTLCQDAAHAGGTPLFADLSVPKADEARSRRVSLKQGATGGAQWFDVTQQRVGAVTVHHAVDIAPVIQAEIAQRNFVQTLAKTFAQLSIGLAIFDRAGQLALFNPALVDLTKLPAEFLSTRPDLASFFDRLRETRMMPEPKSYTSWRTQIASVIAAATDGRYQETWTLETGQTYRVSGRPHPDKAIAFLIEDISAEILLTRNFRSELEMGQSLLDSMDDPIAVFSGTGVLTFSNAAYRALFGVEPDSSFADVTIIDSLRDWQRIYRPDPAFSDIRDFVQDPGDRVAWDCTLRSGDGRLWTCHVQPIARGATAVRMAEHITAEMAAQ